jgi:hypothetical protein
MTARELFGLGLLVVAFTIAPFGYWQSTKWYFVALALGIPGMALYFTDRNVRKFDTSEPDADLPPGPSGGLRGFHGSSVFDNSPDIPDGD